MKHYLAIALILTSSANLMAETSVLSDVKARFTGAWDKNGSDITNEEKNYLTHESTLKKLKNQEALTGPVIGAEARAILFELKKGVQRISKVKVPESTTDTYLEWARKLIRGDKY